MRIISGKFKGRSLKAPKGEITRPTTDRVRESMFNLVYSRMDLDGVQVLDLFAGTGALGIEALSRGAKQVTFVESNKGVLNITRQNAATYGLERQCWFHLSDAVAFVERYRGSKFDLIFADPPYDLEALPRLPEMLFPLLKEQGFLFLEHDARHSFDEHPALETSRAYGRTIVSVFLPKMLNEIEDEADV